LSSFSYLAFTFLPCFHFLLCFLFLSLSSFSDPVNPYLTLCSFFQSFLHFLASLPYLTFHSSSFPAFLLLPCLSVLTLSSFYLWVFIFLPGRPCLPFLTLSSYLTLVFVCSPFLPYLTLVFICSPFLPFLTLSSFSVFVNPCGPFLKFLNFLTFLHFLTSLPFLTVYSFTFKAFLFLPCLPF